MVFKGGGQMCKYEKFRGEYENIFEEISPDNSFSEI